MEAILVVVGFLGAGKTTLLKQLMDDCINTGWNPFVILNDYENAHLDAQQLSAQLPPESIRALSGSCICCSGIAELRDFVNRIPKRNNGITLIEANGTSDACALMGFLGVGLDDRFLPPVQLSVVDVNNWQQRGEHNELEASQVQVSSLIVLTHTQNVSTNRRELVVNELKALNPLATLLTADALDISALASLSPSSNTPDALDHQKAHWSSCSVDLPHLPSANSIQAICDALPKSLVRVKACTTVGKDKNYTYFERCPDGTVHSRAYNGVPVMGAKLLTVGPGSEVALLEKVIGDSLNIQ